MPIPNQIIGAIGKHGRQGCSEPELARYFGLNRYQIRKIMKDMIKYKLISKFLKDCGKQRIW